MAKQIEQDFKVGDFVIVEPHEVYRDLFINEIRSNGTTYQHHGYQNAVEVVSITGEPKDGGYAAEVETHGDLVDIVPLSACKLIIKK